MLTYMAGLTDVNLHGRINRC